MDSISPAAVRTAGNHSGLSGVLDFFDKLMETLWLGTPALASRPSTQARTYRRSSHTSPGLAR